MQEFENMSIREAKYYEWGLPKSTAIRKLKEWSERTSNIDENGFPDTITIGEHKGRTTILKDEHIVFIFEMLLNESTMTVEAVIDQLCEELKNIKMTPR
ncbi:uncharacterized protein BX663DRAFT_411037, partial [Cokeromyces recurvatus]|uniref:uncharacterized protein n=1 Tax=Cokeromyces recurvatus TaxID=90255 RepID=UPI00221F4833